MTLPAQQIQPPARQKKPRQQWARRRGRARTSLLARGEPMLWATGGALALATLMVAGLLGLVLWRGLRTFWPQPVNLVHTTDDRVYMGEITRRDFYRPDEHQLDSLQGSMLESAHAEMAAGDGRLHRRLVRTGNFRITQTHFQWVNDYEVASTEQPDWALVMERLEWGRFYGFPEAFVEVYYADAADISGVAARLRGEGRKDLRLVVEGTGHWELAPLDTDPSSVSLVGVGVVADGAAAAWSGYREHHGDVRERWAERRRLEKFDTGKVNHEQEQARLNLRAAEIELDKAETGSENQTRLQRAQVAVEEERAAYEETRTRADREFARIRRQIDAINRENARYQLVLRTAGEGDKAPLETWMPLDEIVRAYPANRLSTPAKTGIYLDRWAEFLAGEPREANSEGGVFPAIFGTVAMTLIMSLAVVPFGVLAALYLREYAKSGALVSIVRIAVNNLAGVPSIVFGVFGLGFFCYIVGGSIDQILFASSLPNPTFGKGGLLWASLTLALLTLPVVIVATEEAVSAVPNSMREGSIACGASKWQTIRRIVLPRALPGIITGLVLAIARGAGEVAPLMLVGAVKLAPELPIDRLPPFLHPERSFMHLGFHIYDVGFQSQNSEAAQPMVFTTTLLLIGIIALLNMATIWIRSRLRKRFAGSLF